MLDLAALYQSQCAAPESDGIRQAIDGGVNDPDIDPLP
jgi:hypothetical protein